MKILPNRLGTWLGFTVYGMLVVGFIGAIAAGMQTTSDTTRALPTSPSPSAFVTPPASTPDSRLCAATFTIMHARGETHSEAMAALREIAPRHATVADAELREDLESLHLDFLILAMSDSEEIHPDSPILGEVVRAMPIITKKIDLRCQKLGLSAPVG